MASAATMAAATASWETGNGSLWIDSPAAQAIDVGQLDDEERSLWH